MIRVYPFQFGIMVKESQSRTFQGSLAAFGALIQRGNALWEVPDLDFLFLQRMLPCMAEVLKFGVR
jgi:hypothetical protein